MNFESEQVQQVREKLHQALDVTLGRISDLGGQLQSLAKDGADRFRRGGEPEKSVFDCVPCRDAKRTVDQVGRCVSDHKTSFVLAIALVVGVIIGGILLDRRRKIF